MNNLLGKFAILQYNKRCKTKNNRKFYISRRLIDEFINLSNKTNTILRKQKKKEFNYLLAHRKWYKQKNELKKKKNETIKYLDSGDEEKNVVHRLAKKLCDMKNSIFENSFCIVQLLCNKSMKSWVLYSISV